MKRPGKGTLAANAFALLFMLLLYFGDVFDYVRARSADAAAMQKLPNLAFAATVLVAVIVTAALAAAALVRKAPAESKAFRLLPIVAVVAIFVDLFVLSADAPIMSSPAHMREMLQAFAKAAQERSTTQQVASSERELYELVKDFGAPPYLVKGRPVEAFALQRRDGCDGPIADAPGAQVGTFLYCVSKDKKLAWVTVVALPVEERFGAPRVLSAEGVPLFAVVTPQIPDETESLDMPYAERPVAEVLDGGTILPVPIDGGP